MRKHTRHHFLRFSVAAVATLLALVTVSLAQEQQQSFEGFVNGIRSNALVGEVFYQRGDGKFNLEPGVTLQDGDVIKTGTSAYAELLLQPGNYLRVGSESEFQIVSDQYDKMRLQLNRGAVTFEIVSTEGEGSGNYYESLSQLYQLIRVATPNAEVFIAQPGIFRINARAPAVTELIVRDGEAVIDGQRIKQKHSATVSREGFTIAEVDRKVEDGFDTWSRARADEQVQANRFLKHESPWSKKKKDQETTVDFPEDDKQTSNKSRYVVSAKPGAVTFAETGVEFSRAKEWQPVTEKSQLESGDTLRTSAHSYAELELLPDINLRLVGASEISFDQLSNESISFKLLRGSAILDVARLDSKEVPPITLGGLSTSVTIANEGNYRIDVSHAGDEITVRRGKVVFKDRQIGSCRRIAADTISECDKKRKDNFDFWSEHRGEGELYNGRTMVSMAEHLDRLRHIRARNTGFWFQNPGKSQYTFVPFSSPFFRSPYGGSYSTVLSPRHGLLPAKRPEGGGRPFGRTPGPRIAIP